MNMYNPLPPYKERMTHPYIRHEQDFEADEHGGSLADLSARIPLFPAVSRTKLQTPLEDKIIAQAELDRFGEVAKPKKLVSTQWKRAAEE